VTNIISASEGLMVRTLAMVQWCKAQLQICRLL